MEIEITEADIKHVEMELGLRLNDAERIAVLKEIKSCDVQAGPGSGKRTILIAKLAILARKWPFRDRGVCVLSHTNVARKEIEHKLQASPGLRRLLQYPHFIGTIQTFVDQFLAIPFLRRESIEVTAIDNDRFAARAWSLFCKKCPTGRAAILKWCQSDVERAKGIVGSLRLEGAHMGVTHSMAGASRFPKASSDTGKGLINVKQALRAEGYFRYDDMYAFAEACLFKVPYVAPALRRRFPWVFVDELQDTSQMQDSIIEKIFGAGECIFQRFGDKNQAIFDFESDSNDAPSLFGRRNILFLNGTHRFDDSIAALASRFTVVEPQALVGNNGLAKCEHTVFVFDRPAVKRVIPLFGDLVLKNVSVDILQRLPVCVVASRVNAAQHKIDRFPSFLGDYADVYVSPNATKPKSPDTFLGYLIEARKKWRETGAGNDPCNLALSGILALIRRADVASTGISAQTKASLREALLRSGTLSVVQKILWQMLKPAAALNKDQWKTMTVELAAAIGHGKLSKEQVSFLVWEDCDSALPAAAEKSSIEKNGIYHHQNGNAILPIRFDSIHGVKGETHAATLVVETFARQQHDMKVLLPVLTGAMHGSKLANAARGHGKRTFVGMSRPRHLLCLAISGEHVSAKEIELITSNGWNVVTVH